MMDLVEVALDRVKIAEHAKVWDGTSRTNKYDRMMAAKIAELEEAIEKVDSGAQVIDLNETLRRGGAGTNGFPKLGFAPARLHGSKWEVAFSSEAVIFGRFFNRPPFARPVLSPIRPRIRFMGARWGEVSRQWSSLSWNYAHTLIPRIPPPHRVHGLPGNILIWEATWRAKVPRLDPALVRPIGNGLAEVLATWDLTDIEAESMRYL